MGKDADTIHPWPLAAFVSIPAPPRVAQVAEDIRGETLSLLIT